MPIRLFASLAMFLGSYLPLSIILLAQDVDYASYQVCCWKFWQLECGWLPSLKHPWYSMPILLLCLTCFLISVFALMGAKPKNPVNISKSKYIPAELMSYTLPYVVSFMNLDYQETGKFIGLMIFMVWMFLITHRSGQILLNPLFVALGWRLYEIEFSYPGAEETRQGRALAKEAIEPSSQAQSVLVQNVMILKGHKGST